MIRAVIKASVVLGLAILTACGGRSSPALAPRPVGTISGIVESYRSSDKTHLSPASGLTVTAYRQAFPLMIGTAPPQPKPVTHATTNQHGRFVLRGLKPGRYFLVVSATAHWVALPQGVGATTRFVICADCPIPA